MVSDKIYLDSDITLKKLALRVDCSVNHLSQIINAGFGMKYFDLLQYYRINDAKKMLEENDNHISSMLDIAYNSGVNSHSAFYLAFKKLTGKTPAQYRRDHQLKTS